MNLNIDRNSKTPLTKQLYDELENRITSGILKPNTPLPSIRKAAQVTGLSPMTVVKAYELLERNKLIYKSHGKGTFVKGNVYLHEESVSIHSPKAENWQNSIQDYVIRTGYVQRTLFNSADLSCNLGTAALNERFLPTEDIIDMFLKSYNKIQLEKYPPVEGAPDLLRKVCTYLIDKGIKSSGDEVVITSGSQLAIHLIAQTFIGHGDVVIVEAPTFPGAIDVFKSRGALVLEVPMTKDGLDVDRLLILCEKYPVKLLYTMPVFHNPTGISASLEVMQEVLLLAKEHNFIIVEDDSWSDLYYERSERPLKGLDKDGRVLYIAGLSKTLGPSYRLSAIAADPILCQKLVTVKSHLDSGAPLISQLMVAAYLDSLEHKKHLIWVRYELKELLNRIKTHLSKISPPYVNITIPKGGLVLWITLPSSFDCRLLYYKALSDANISFLLGENCYSSLRGNNQLRVCFAYAPEELVISSLTKLFTMIEELHQLMGKGTQIAIT